MRGEQYRCGRPDLRNAAKLLEIRKTGRGSGVHAAVHYRDLLRQDREM